MGEILGGVFVLLAVILILTGMAFGWSKLNNANKADSELAEMPEWLTTLLVLGPELVASLQRCAEGLQWAINDSTDPGTEALGAVYEAKVLLGRLQRGVLALEHR